MQSHIVTSTADIKKIIPYLSRTDKFKRSIDKCISLFAEGVKFNIADDGMHFTSQSKNWYKIRIDYKDRCYYLANIKLSKDCFGKILQHQTETNWAKIALGLGTFMKSFDMLSNETAVVHSCTKCNGTGFIPQFAWYAEGVCFECMGVGKSIELKSKHTHAA